jgi:hypothetical protein
VDDPRAAQLRTEIEAIRHRLQDMPLEKGHRDERLQLNQKVLELQGQLTAHEAEVRHKALRVELDRLRAEMKALPNVPESKPRRLELVRRITAVTVDLDSKR